MSLRQGSGVSRDKIFTAVVYGAGLICGLAWFIRAYFIPETTSAWYSGDPHYYVAQSLIRPGELFKHSHWRVFGYPFYLSVLRGFFPDDSTWRLLAFVLQFLCCTGASWFLVVALRRQGLKIPSVVVAFTFAHPALAGIAGIPMSEALTTAAISAALAWSMLLLQSRRGLILQAVLLGFTLGLVLCIRAQLLGFVGAMILVVGLAVGCIKYHTARQVFSSLMTSVCFFTFALGAASPFVLHLLNNCKRSYGEFCLIEPGLARAAMRESVLVRANRLWYVPLPNPETVFVCKNIPYPVPLSDCELSSTDFLRDLVHCYQGHYPELPRLLGERLLGSFDNRHIHPYASKETSSLESALIRGFSVLNLVGVVAVTLMWLFSIGSVEAFKKSYLLLPLIFIAGQIHFHPEPRYYYPIVPLLFISGLSCLISSPFSRKWQRFIFLFCSVGIAICYAVKVIEWDRLIAPPLCKTDYDRLYKPSA